MVLVTHDARVAAYADREVMVRDGLVTALDPRTRGLALMIRLGLQLALRSGREALVRLLVTAAAVAHRRGRCCSACSPNTTGTRPTRDRPCWECTQGTVQALTLAPAGQPGWLWNYSQDIYQGRTIERLDVAALGPGAPVAPGHVRDARPPASTTPRRRWPRCCAPCRPTNWATGSPARSPAPSAPAGLPARTSWRSSSATRRPSWPRCPAPSGSPRSTTAPGPGAVHRRSTSSGSASGARAAGTDADADRHRDPDGRGPARGAVRRDAAGRRDAAADQRGRVGGRGGRRAARRAGRHRRCTRLSGRRWPARAAPAPGTSPPTVTPTAWGYLACWSACRRRRRSRACFAAPGADLAAGRQPARHPPPPRSGGSLPLVVGHRAVHRAVLLATSGARRIGARGLGLSLVMIGLMIGRAVADHAGAAGWCAGSLAAPPAAGRAAAGGQPAGRVPRGRVAWCWRVLVGTTLAGARAGASSRSPRRPASAALSDVLLDSSPCPARTGSGCRACAPQAGATLVTELRASPAPRSTRCTCCRRRPTRTTRASTSPWSAARRCGDAPRTRAVRARRPAVQTDDEPLVYSDNPRDSTSTVGQPRQPGYTGRLTALQLRRCWSPRTTRPPWNGYAPCWPRTRRRGTVRRG